ncbi:MAG: phosphate acyltransferase PlsX [Gemmatimonadetes bacterium]|nr:phosphate acyltransferase PlsX [Gemmatimonadota bacterium]
MRIALDAMGTDRHPAVEVEGGVAALRELSDDFGIVFVGDAARIETHLARWPEAPRDRIEVVHAQDAILPGESAAAAVRRKPNSSIVVGLALHKERRVDAFISAGSTGAVMAASLFALRRLPGVDRPAIATILPTAAQPLLLIDAGANVDSKPAHLVQFARLGSIYVEDAWRRPNPRVGLLNIGEEPEKGDECTVEAHRLLRAATDLNFVGNIEGRDIIRGPCDVLVADGFVGNVLLKFYESVTAFFHGLVGEKLNGLVPQRVLDGVFDGFDYAEYGGAPLLGVNGITIICHGGSPPRAIRNAIRVARQAIETRMLGHIERVIGPAADTAAV